MYEVHEWAKVRELYREGAQQEGHRPAPGHEPQHGGAPAGERRAAALRARARRLAARSLQGRRARDAAQGRERAGHGDPRAPAARGLRRRHHHPQGVPGERAPAVQGGPRLRTHHATRPASSCRPTGGTPASTCRSARARAAAPTASSRRCPSRPPTPWSSRTRRPRPTPCPPSTAASSASAACRASWSSTTTPASSCAVAARVRAPWTSSPPCSARSPWAASCCPRRRPQSKGSRGAHQRLPRDLVPAPARVCRSRRPAGAERRLDGRASPGRAITAASAPGWSRRSPWSAPSSRRCPTRRRPPTGASSCASAATASCAPPASTTRCRRATPGAGSPCTSRCTSWPSSARAAQVARHARSYVPADVVRDPAHMAALAAAQEAQRRLRGGDLELPAVDLARYDALVGAPL